MIGVSAVGVSRLPPVEYDDADVALDAPLPILEPIPALSMSDVAPLEAWWAALETAEIIELTATRVRPGPAADQARASVVPLELCELVVACVVAEALTSELRASAYFADQVLAVAVSRLLNALDPSLKITESAEALFGGLLVPRALSLIAHLERLGLAQLLPGGGCVVPPELRGAVARGIILALRYIDEVFGPEPPLVE